MKHRTSRVIPFCLAMLLAASGCYTSQMTTSDLLVPGASTVLTITDQGRAAFAPKLGPGVMRISGKLAEHTDTTLTLRVSTVSYVGGAISAWSGEPVIVPRAYVGIVEERRLSKPRTFTLVGAAVTAVVVAVLSFDLLNVAGGNPDDGGGVVQP